MVRKYPKQPYTTSGKLITRLTHTLSQEKGWSMEATMDYVGKCTGRSSDMVYRWQQGRTRPKPEIIEKLAKIGFEEANMAREWCEQLLHVTYYPDAIGLLNELWGPKELRPIPYKLVHREHTRLIGRETEMKFLQKLLSPAYAAPLITIDGIGGVGKTALALEVAHQSWRASVGEISKPHFPTFEAIIFVSAKQQTLTPAGILQSSQTHQTLHKIFHEVMYTLQRFDIRSKLLQEQPDLVREALGNQRTLLIVDNLETMENKQEIISFLYQLPPTVKAVITTRERTMFAPIRLEQLAEEAALELIMHQADEKQIKLTKEEAKILYAKLGGIPAALVYAVGQRAAGYSLETVLHNVSKADGDVARFCFQNAVEPMRGKKIHEMLMTFAFFPAMPDRATIAHITDLSTAPFVAEEALSQLQLLSLVREIDNRFRVLPLTREYALAELHAHPEFESKARVRWLEWYQNFALQYGGHDNKEWHIRFDHLEKEWDNLLEVFDWCAAHDHYDIVKSFWTSEDPHSMVDFTTLYGLWDDRIKWLEWLIDAAKGRGDWTTYLDAIASMATTLTLIGRRNEAADLFAQGHKLSSYADPHVFVRLLDHNAYLYIFQEHFGEAHELLAQARTLARQLEEPLRTRMTINIEYDHAAVHYWQGDYVAALDKFTFAMEEAKRSGWHRLENYAQNYLADIAIQEGRYEDAKRLLETGLIIAERNKEKRRIACYQRSHAYLYHKQGQLKDALSWANEAQEGFRRLGMDREFQQMASFINEIQKEPIAQKDYNKSV